MSDFLKRRAQIGGPKSLISQHKLMAMGVFPFVGTAIKKAQEKVKTVKTKAKGGIVKKKT